ncbi:MAG: M56 family metallopeptidase [Blautia sp.]|uniref:M56 family metallopeptidase n=1 Tax=Blautia sp. TaxID=1955243 RepID=UPI0039954C95
MEVFVLHILKLNIIAAVVILLVKVFAALSKGKVSARWKYFIWLFVTVSLMIPVQLPSTLSLVNFKVQRSSQLEPKTENHAVRPKESQQLTEAVPSASNNMESQTEVSAPKGYITYKSGKWTKIAAVIVTVIWLSVALLKLAGELLSYYLSMRNLKRMSIQVSDPVSIQMYREACRRKHVRKMPELRRNAGLTTPLLAGLFHTKLYLPATGYSAEERKLVFYHELTHYCHRDLWYKMLLRVCASIYWFNPFLLIMLKEADKDIENLCDTAVVNRVNKKDHRLYRQLLLRTVAMENQIPYVTASLNDSGMVFKDRILYMVNLRKLRRGILPGILVTALLAGGNLVFNVSAGTDTVPVKTEKSDLEKNTNPEEKNAPDYAPFSQLVNMQQVAEPQSEEGVAENAETETSVQQSEEGSNSSDTEENTSDNSEGTEENNSADSEDNSDDLAVISTAPMVLADSNGNTITVKYILYEDNSYEYRGDDGMTYTDNGDETYTDENGNTYSALNDDTHHLGYPLEQHHLQDVEGNTITVTQTTNGDYYFADENGTGFTNNGDGTWYDENGSSYTEID